MDSNTTMGAAIAIGTGLGVALFAVFGEAFWIAIGAALGTGIGVALQGNQNQE